MYLHLISHNTHTILNYNRYPVYISNNMNQKILIFYTFQMIMKIFINLGLKVLLDLCMI